jgi:deoxyinosine 3'endonuclease (endonuclease V)
MHFQSLFKWFLDFLMFVALSCCSRTLDMLDHCVMRTGHQVSLRTACAVVLACCQYRMPEPIRQADLLSREYVRSLTTQ